jgi:hypothetical protein
VCTRAASVDGEQTSLNVHESVVLFAQVLFVTHTLMTLLFDMTCIARTANTFQRPLRSGPQPETLLLAAAVLLVGKAEGAGLLGLSPKSNDLVCFRNLHVLCLRFAVKTHPWLICCLRFGWGAGRAELFSLRLLGRIECGNDLILTRHATDCMDTRRHTGKAQPSRGTLKKYDTDQQRASSSASRLASDTPTYRTTSCAVVRCEAGPPSR